MFPETVYRVPGAHRGPKGCTYDYKGVADADALKAAKKAGWSETLDKAMGADGAKEVLDAAEEFEDAVDDVSPATRDELEAKAKELGIGFNSRTKDKTLAERIAEAVD